MRKRRKNNKDSRLLPLIIFLGILLFLLMEHPIIFWLLVILFLSGIVVLIVGEINKHSSKNSHGSGFFSGIAGVSKGVSTNRSGKKHNHDGKCDGDCKNCPPHYGYRHGRWYYGHGHNYGCEFGGNKGGGGQD